MDSKKKVYEVGYLVVPSVSPDHIQAEVEKMHGVIKQNGGDVISEDSPKMIRLAYEMSKVVGNKRTRYDTGYFGWVKFFGTEEGIVEIKKYFDLDEKVLRFLITKTVAESTLYGHKIVPEKPKFEKSDDRVTPKVEEKVEINQEELDKSIDKLVIE